MTQRYTEFGPIEGSEDIQATSAEGDERLFLPSGYAGYDDDGEPNWTPVVEAMVDGSATPGNIIESMGDGAVEAASLAKETTIRNVADSVDEIVTEEQAEALIDYLASEEYVEGGEVETKIPPLELDGDSVVLFDDDVEGLADDGATEKLFNVAILFAATAQGIDEHLQQVDRIAEGLAAVEFEELHDARETFREIEQELEAFGEGEGVPTREEYQQLSTDERREVDVLAESYRMYAYIDEIDLELLELAENLNDLDWDRYHDSLSAAKEMYRATEANVMNIARQTKMKADSRHGRTQ